MAVLVLGIAAAAAAPLWHGPFGLRIALGIAGLLGVVWAAIGRRPVVQASGTYVEADAVGLTRVTEDLTKSIITWDGPFGVALLASYGRPTALLAFTTPTQTRYVPARIDDRSEIDDELLARIAVLADLDLVDGVAHDAALTATATAALVRHVEGRDKDALGRVFLSDGRAAPRSCSSPRCPPRSCRARPTRTERPPAGSAAPSRATCGCSRRLPRALPHATYASRSTVRS
jgi:hypothetical protein